MKILSATQIKQVDAWTIEHEPISSIDLMERASSAFVKEFMKKWDNGTSVIIFAGPGNNGGDALAIGRLLFGNGYNVKVFLFKTNANLSNDCLRNRERLSECDGISFDEITTSFAPPQLTKDDIVIDGLFGTGLSRALNGGFASVVKYINASPATVVSIDVPSGLMCEDNSYNWLNHIVKADFTYTFQFPKLSFFFPEYSEFVGEWKIIDIGISDPENELTKTPYKTTTISDVARLLRERSKFSHKGNVGHAALIAGKKGMAGAAILASRACMRTGVGKLTLRTPESNTFILQTTVPEVIVSPDKDMNVFTTTMDTSEYDALAIGPGIGTDSQTTQAFIEQVSYTKCPLVLDADALNILGSHRGWIQQLPRKSVLTPHKKELFGLISTTQNSFEELERTRELAMKQQIFIVIKGAYSVVCTPEGAAYFNTSGNPGMATAGSGDVLTGIILSLLAQDYPVEDAVIAGVYLHGLAGDLAAENLGYESMLASDIVDNLSGAFLKLKKIKDEIL